MKHQSKTGDGLIWIGKLFRPNLFKSTLYLIVSPFMLRKDAKAMGRGVRRLPFRKAMKRDNWEQSSSAIEVGNRWNKIRRSGGRTSFSESSD